jgi:tetratricopeptide (TPR) repeat protein
VERRHLIENRFNYEQAMELYDAALWAFPKPYPLLEHHKCLVKRRLGGNLREVYDELRGLVAKSHDRSILDQDSPANLNTSAAATLNQLIKQNEIDPADGANAAFDHITAALQHDQFSLHTHHVHADLLVKIAGILRTKDRSAFMTNIERAARIVDRALLLIPRSGPKSAEQSKSLKLFKELRSEISIGFSDLEEARKAAIDSFKNSGEQSGLAFVSRMMLGKAIESTKGHQFKKVDDFLRDAFREIAGADISPSYELVLCRVELVVNWHLFTDHGPVYWEQFSEDLHQLQQNPRFADDVLCTFYAGVAYFNMRKFVEAEASFQRLRRDGNRNQFRKEIRCHFLGDKTEPRVFEGKISASASDKRFIYCAELGTDIPVRYGQLTQRPDELKHFKIGFSMLGAIAVER